MQVSIVPFDCLKDYCNVLPDITFQRMRIGILILPTNSYRITVNGSLPMQNRAFLEGGPQIART